jgi:ABC-2 type transport system ATP-binding protein
MNSGSSRKNYVLKKKKAGGAEGIRTPDPHNAIVVLYQLSYDPSLLEMERQFRCRSRKVKRFAPCAMRPIRSSCGLRNHPALPREIEQPARIHHRLHVTQRLQLIDLAGLVDLHRGGIQVDRDHVAGLHDVAEPLSDFAGIKFARRNAVPEENARKTFGDNNARIGRAHRNRGVLAGTAAPEILPGDHDGILRVHLPFLDEPLWVKFVRQAAKGVAAKLFVFLLDGRNEVQILRGNDLVGVDIVLHHVYRTCKHGLHKPWVICWWRADKSNSILIRETFRRGCIRITPIEAVLAVEGLSKRYGATIAVDGISFQVRRNEIVGLLGPNGAGKTTTINMVLGVLSPTAGSIHIDGIDLGEKRSEAMARTNFAAVYAQLPGNLTVEENLRVFGMIYAVRDLSARIERVLEQFDLVQFRKTKTGVLSSGEQTRVSLAKAMINNPELLLLDEPTASLDPATAREIRARIREFARAGTAAVLWTSHNMYEVTEVCDRVLFLSHGKVLLEGNPNTLPAEHGKETLEDLFVTVAREPLTLGTNGR